MIHKHDRMSHCHMELNTIVFNSNYLILCTYKSFIQEYLQNNKKTPSRYFIFKLVTSHTTDKINLLRERHLRNEICRDVTFPIAKFSFRTLLSSNIVKKQVCHVLYPGVSSGYN